MQEGLRILSSEIINFKNLAHKEIDFGGKSVMIIGSNNKGKSSIIQALMSPLNATYKPLKPVKEGEEKGSIEIVIGGSVKGVEKKYKIEMYFSQENQKGRLVLLDGDDQKIPSPASALDAIIGNISFDIDEFIALSKTRSGGFSKEGALKQIEILKGFLPKEIREELMQCDIDIKELKDSRAEINKEIKTLSEKLKHEYSDEELELYQTVKPIEPIQEKLKNIGDASQKYAKAVAARNSLMDQEIQLVKELNSGMSQKTAKHNLDVIANFEGSIEDKNDQSITTFMVHLAKLKKDINSILEKAAKLPEVQADIQKIVKWLSKNEEPKSQDIIDELNLANEHNEHCKKVAELKEMHTLVEKKKELYKSMESKIKDLQDRKREIFASNPLPVKNLSFDEEQVLYKGLPFNEETHPSSVIIGVGVKIAMSMNPGLKVIIIKDGSLLDKDTAKAILTMTEKYGYQVIMEVVSWEAKETEIRFLEKEL